MSNLVGMMLLVCGFCQVLDDTGDNLDLAPALYTKRRLADVHAMQKLEFMEVNAGFSIFPNRV